MTHTSAETFQDCYDELVKENAQLKAELEQARQREARQREALQELRDLRYGWR